MCSISGHAVVTTPGTAVALGNMAINGRLAVRGLYNNANAVYVGAANVSSSNGFELDASTMIIFHYVGHLSSVYVDAQTENDGVSWLMLDI